MVIENKEYKWVKRSSTLLVILLLPYSNPSRLVTNNTTLKTISKSKGSENGIMSAE